MKLFLFDQFNVMCICYDKDNPKLHGYLYSYARYEYRPTFFISNIIPTVYRIL